MDTANQWKIIHAYFEDNPQALVAHHLESYNDFFKNGIFQIFKEKNPVSLSSVYDENLGDFKHQCHMYLGGKDGSRIYFGKPVIYDEKQSHYMFPNEARLRNMTYGMTVHYDIEIEFLDLLEPGESPGIVTDKAIIEMCLLDLDKYEHMIDTFVPSVHDAGSMMTQSLAIEYIASLTKGKRTEHALEILSDYLHTRRISSIFVKLIDVSITFNENITINRISCVFVFLCV